MNFEQGFESNFEKYCKDNGLLVAWYKNYDKMETTNNISEVEAFAFCNPYRTIKLPKTKLITMDYILERLNKESTFINLAKYLRNLLNANMNCYPTSYGIGIFCLFARKGDVSKIEAYLNNNLIEYRNEYSDAYWVYRFIISKSSQNIEKLKAL